MFDRITLGHLGLALAVLGWAGCADGGGTVGGPTVIADVGFATPESVLHDPAEDIYLVSNINGNPLEFDDNGFISQLSPEGEVLLLKWIDGEQDFIELNAPKGMAIIGDTLFVADIEVVRLFDRAGGSPLGNWFIPGATFLNDLAVGADGYLYVSDTGLRAGENGLEPSGTSAVWRFSPTGTPIPVLRHDIDRPNGLVATGDSITVVSFGPGEVFTVGAGANKTVLGTLPGTQLDGVVAMSDGSLIISDWETQSIYRLYRRGKVAVVMDGVEAPADIGFDVGRHQLLVPLFTTNRVLLQVVE